MPMKKVTQTEIIVAEVLRQMEGERWQHLRQKLETKGLRALIAETTLEETKIIQEKVAETKQHWPTTPQDERYSILACLQQALRKGIEQSTAMTWPALYQESFEA